jgi:hypothetical protein
MAQQQQSPQTFEFRAENQNGFKVENLFTMLNDEVLNVRQQLQKIQNNKENISVADMFEMQMMMNHLSQVSEMSTAIVQQSNTAIQSMTRAMKS